MKGIQLTIEEKQLLIEALLFSASVDVCAEWTNKHKHVILELANKLNDKDIKLDNIYFFDEGPYDDDKTIKMLAENFPNIPREHFTID